MMVLLLLSGLPVSISRPSLPADEAVEHGLDSSIKADWSRAWLSAASLSLLWAPLSSL